MTDMLKTGVIIVTHGPAGLDMIETAERMVGRLGVTAVPVPLGEACGEIERRLEEAVGQLETDEVLFLVDLEGSTPFNVCCRQCRRRSVVLTGMNMPMLFKLATADRSHGAEVLAEELRATGMKSIHIRSGGLPAKAPH